MSLPEPLPGRRWVRTAAVLQIVQGALMEGLPFLALLVLLFAGVEQSALTEHAQVFALSYFQDNLYLMMAMSGVFAALRITAAIGLLKHRMWGMALSLVVCVLTLALMAFMLPAGVFDGLFAGTALVLILVARYGDAPIGPVGGRRDDDA